jgi:hypothetical protein
MLTTIEKCLYSLTTSLINLKGIFCFSLSQNHVFTRAMSSRGDDVNNINLNLCMHVQNEGSSSKHPRPWREPGGNVTLLRDGLPATLTFRLDEGRFRLSSQFQLISRVRLHLRSALQPVLDATDLSKRCPLR